MGPTDELPRFRANLREGLDLVAVAGQNRGTQRSELAHVQRASTGIQKDDTDSPRNGRRRCEFGPVGRRSCAVVGRRDETGFVWSRHSTDSL